MFFKGVYPGRGVDADLFSNEGCRKLACVLQVRKVGKNDVMRVRREKDSPEGVAGREPHEREVRRRVVIEESVVRRENNKNKETERKGVM